MIKNQHKMLKMLILVSTKFQNQHIKKATLK